MEWLRGLFGGGLPPLPPPQREEVERLMAELLTIGQKEDFLSERPGAGFNAQCQHIRTRAIGARLHAIGGLPLMQSVHDRLKRKLGATLTAHLEYAWNEIGQWVP